jgi:ankyrin repeat protein
VPLARSWHDRPGRCSGRLFFQPAAGDSVGLPLLLGRDNDAGNNNNNNNSIGDNDSPFANPFANAAAAAGGDAAFSLNFPCGGDAFIFAKAIATGVAIIPPQSPSVHEPTDPNATAKEEQAVAPQLLLDSFDDDDDDDDDFMDLFEPADKAGHATPVLLPLHNAVAMTQPLDRIKEIVRSDPAAVRRVDSAGRTPLHVAIASQAPEGLVRFLVDECPDTLHDPDDLGWLPLHLAAQHPKLETRTRDTESSAFGSTAALGSKRSLPDLWRRGAGFSSRSTVPGTSS